MDGQYVNAERQRRAGLGDFEGGRGRQRHAAVGDDERRIHAGIDQREPARSGFVRAVDDGSRRTVAQGLAAQRLCQGERTAQTRNVEDGIAHHHDSHRIGNQRPTTQGQRVGDDCRVAGVRVRAG